MQLIIKVTPQAQGNKVIGFYQNMLKVALIGVPEKGKLNELLINFLADQFNIPKKAIILKQGFTNPVKRLEIAPEFAFKVELYLAKYKPDPSFEDEVFTD